MSNASSCCAVIRHLCLREDLNSLLDIAGIGQPLRLGLAVSGGSDSLALLKLAHVWKQRMGDKAPFFYAFTVHHHLRAEADLEIQGVADYCKQWNIPHQVLDWYPSEDEVETSLQENARFARHNLLRDACYCHDLQGLLLAHTQTDQHETILFRALRQSDTNGFIGISPVVRRAIPEGQQNPLYLFRPLLGYTREDLRAFLKKHNLKWFDDKSNEDVNYTRIALRQSQPLFRQQGLREEITSKLAQKAQILRLLEQNEVAFWIKNSVKVHFEGWICIESFPISERIAVLGIIRLLKLCKETLYSAVYETILKIYNDFIKNRKTVTVGGAVWVFYKEKTYLFPEVREKKKKETEKVYPLDIPHDLRKYFSHKPLIHPTKWDFVPFTDFSIQQCLSSV